MGKRICHEHCPPGGGGESLLRTAVILGGLLAGGYVAMGLWDAVWLPLLITVWSVVAVGAGVVVWRIRADGPMWRPEVAQEGRLPLAMPGHPPLPARARAALSARPVTTAKVINVEPVPVRADGG